jgi:PAS domain S-box-containing protein
MSAEKNLPIDKLTQNVPGVIYQFKIDAAGKSSMPYANGRLKEVFGLHPHEVIDSAEPIFDLVHSEDINNLFNSINYSRDHLSDWEYEFRIIIDNKIKWLRGVARPELLTDNSLIWHGYILDVTERKTIEEDNLQTRIKYQGYFESATDGLFVVNREGYYKEANPAACKMTGYSLNELLQMHVTDLVAKGYANSENITLEKSFKFGSVDEEIVLRRKDGEKFWVRLVTSKIDDDVVIAFCHDITVRKKQDELLRQQLEFQQLIAQTSSGFVNLAHESFEVEINFSLKQFGRFFQADRCYIFLFVNNNEAVHNAYEWCSDGVSEQKLNLQNLDLNQFKWWQDQLLNNKVIHIPDLQKLIGPDQSEKDILLSQQIKSLLSIPMYNNGILIGFLGLDRVTKQESWSESQIKQFKVIAEIMTGVFAKYDAERGMRLSENRYRLLAENARDVIYRVLLSPEIKYDYVSPSVFHLTGYKPEEFYNNSLIHNELFLSENQIDLNCINPSMYSFDKPVICRLKKKDGTLTWCEQSNVPIRNSNNEIIAIEGIARDINDQKAFEEKLTALNTELIDKKNALENLNQSLEDRIAKEVEKNRRMDQIMALQARQAAIGEMIANIAHQWRQPLNVLSLAVFDIADAFDYGELDKKYIENTVEEMNRVIQDMSKTIDDFRNYFKPDKEKVHFKISNIINNAISFLSPYFDAENIIIKKDTPSDITLFGYASQIEQVVINLLKNSLDSLSSYSDGEREILIKAQKTSNNNCIISVYNSGWNIPEKNFVRLFDPYFTTKPEGKGLGLGLYVAKIIIEKNMGGNIYFKNVENGVVFEVHLPFEQN